MVYVDGSLYPDQASPPLDLMTVEERADYLHRVCAAWDFHVHPEPATFALLAGWRDVFDRFPAPLSPAYHALRAYFGWPPLPNPVGLEGPEPRYVALDRLEGRGADPCEFAI